MLPQRRVSETFAQHLAARSPCWNGVTETFDVIDAADAHLPARELALHLASADHTRTLLGRVVHAHAATDPPPQQQPVELLGELVGCRRESAPNAATLFATDPPVGFEDAEEQVAHDRGGYV